MEQESVNPQNATDDNPWNVLTEQADAGLPAPELAAETQLTPADLPPREHKLLDAKLGRLQYQYRSLYGKDQSAWPDGAAAGLRASLDTIEQESLHYYAVKQAAPEGSTEFYTAAANSVIFDSHNRAKFADMIANPRTAQRAQFALGTLEYLAANDVDGAVNYLNDLKSQGEGHLVSSCVRDVAKLADEDMDGLVSLLIEDYNTAPVEPVKQNPLLDKLDAELVGVNHQASKRPHKFPWQRKAA